MWPTYSAERGTTGAIVSSNDSDPQFVQLENDVMIGLELTLQLCHGVIPRTLDLLSASTVLPAGMRIRRYSRFPVCL